MYLVVVMRYCEVNACISSLHLDGVIGLISKYHTLIFVFCRVPFKKKMPRDVCLTVYIGSFWMPIPRAQTLMERRHGLWVLGTYTTRTWNVIFAYLVLFERSTLLLLIRQMQVLSRFYYPACTIINVDLYANRCHSYNCWTLAGKDKTARKVSAMCLTDHK